MRMYLCPAHERVMRQTYWMTETGNYGQCGLCGCANTGTEFDMVSNAFRRPRRSNIPVSQKDTRARYKGDWREMDE